MTIPPNNSMEPTRPAAANRVYDRFQELAGRLISRPLGGNMILRTTGPLVARTLLLGTALGACAPAVASSPSISPTTPLPTGAQALIASPESHADFFTPATTDLQRAPPTLGPTPGPIQPVLVELGTTGGDGCCPSQALFEGANMPDLVLYPDGRLLLKRDTASQMPQYDEVDLSPNEVCSFLDRIRDTGFLTVEGTGQLYPDDPIYREPTDFGDGAGGYLLVVNAQPAKFVYVYSRAVDNLIPEVAAALSLVRAFAPGPTASYSAERVVALVERQPGNTWYGPTPPPLGTWPEGLPPLRELLTGDNPSRIVEFSSQEAQPLMKTILPGVSGSFTERGSVYFVLARYLLPHETAQYFSEYEWRATPVALPFSCSE